MQPDSHGGNQIEHTEKRMPMGKMIRDEQNARFTEMTNDSVHRLLD